MLHQFAYFLLPPTLSKEKYTKFKKNKEQNKKLEAPQLWKINVWASAQGIRYNTPSKIKNEFWQKLSNNIYTELSEAGKINNLRKEGGASSASGTSILPEADNSNQLSQRRW